MTGAMVGITIWAAECFAAWLKQQDRIDERPDAGVADCYVM